MDVLVTIATILVAFVTVLVGNMKQVELSVCGR